MYRLDLYNTQEKYWYTWIKSDDIDEILDSAETFIQNPNVSSIKISEEEICD